MEPRKIAERARTQQEANDRSSASMEPRSEDRGSRRHASTCTQAGKAEEVAAACFVASDASSFMTGEMVNVDGGLMMD